jgi:ribosomal protein S18 acetylase RimI-like enzyme
VDLFYNNLTGTGWRYADLTAAAGAPVAAGPPNGYTWTVDNTQHVVYEGNDSHIHELYYSSSAGWRHGDLTANTGAPPAAGPPYGYTWSADNTEHVVFEGNDSHIHELYYSTSANWRRGDLIAATGAPVAAAPPNGSPRGYTWSVDNTEHVVYEGNDAHIHDLYYSYNAGAWRHTDLSAAAGAPAAAAPPFGYTWSVDNTQHVVYEGSDSHIHELHFSSGAGWGHTDLTAATGAPPAAGPPNGSPNGYTWSVDNTQHVVYEGNDSHIHEFHFSSNAGWGHTDLTAAAGAPVASGPPNGYTWSVDNTQHVVYQGSDAHIYDLYFHL